MDTKKDAEVDEKNKQLQAHKRECDEAVRIAKNAQAKAYEERVLFESRLNAMRFEYGLIEDENEFVPKIPFEELERQYHMLRKLFKQEWTKVKKDIRTRILWILFKRTIDDDDVLLGVNPTPQIPTAPTMVSTAEQVMDMTENLAVKVDTDAEDAVEETSEDVIEEVAVDAEDEFKENLEDSDEEIEEEIDEDESEEDEESDEEEDEADEEVEMAQTETEETKVSDAQEGIADTSSTDEE